ncbi:MAG: DUF1800 family protein [Verrucomicrobia bacterium]|nr:DUF1800 family protein [Verrucomicrobiota bacterium]
MRVPQLILTLLSATPLGVSAMDLDGDGLCDVWQARWHALALPPDSDADGDGFSQREEAAAGTDPLDGASRPLVSVIDAGSATARLRIVAQPGKRYRAESAASPAGPWIPSSTDHAATDALLEIVAPTLATHAFYRVRISDADSDGDGVSDWAERQLAGFDPLNADSFALPEASGDAAVAAAMIEAWNHNAISAEIVTAAAYEKDGSPAQIRLTRSGDTGAPFTLFFKVVPDADPRRATPGRDEYQLRDASGAVVTHALVIPAGQSSASLMMHPVADALIEVPEYLDIRAGGSIGPLSLSVRDAAPVQANQRLFIAYLLPAAGVSSAGSGLATIRLSGDNDSAIVSLWFSNLNSAVNSTQVQTADDAILQSIPPFAYNGQAWRIRASQSYATDQSVLDALIDGSVELSIFTEANVAGELSGAFSPAVGFVDMPEPIEPPAVTSLSGTALDREIVRFLTQATFGPTPADLADLRSRVAAAGGDRIAAFSAWIDEQFATPSPDLLDYTMAADRQDIEIRLDPAKSYYNPDHDPGQGNRRRGWWLLARHGPDQLKQRAAFAFSEIFVISIQDTLIESRAHGSAHYHDMLRNGATGTFRDLLRNVATHPMMGWYLSHLRNAKATYDAQGNLLVSPDENFAREIMQLFSIGLVQLHNDGSLKLGSDGLPLPTYTQTDITELSRVFTGWSFSVYNNPSASTNVVANTLFSRNNGSERFEDRWMQPMRNFADSHDTGAKQVLGLQLPANRSGEQELDAIVDHLATHPNTAPFICRRLIQRFVTANPSAGYLHRVSNAFRDAGGSMNATIKAILLDPEARSLESADAVASFGKVREPLLRYTAFARAFNGTSKLKLADLSAYGYPADELAKFPENTARFRMQSTDTQLSQTHLSAPSVFNWFVPDHKPAGMLAANGTTSPELQIANENSVIRASNFVYSDIYESGGNPNTTALPNQNEEPWLYGSNGDHIRIDFAPLEALYLGVVDLNRDGVFNNLDVGAFNQQAALRAACEAVLDHVDLMLCAGALKARYAETPGKPRRNILDAAVSIRSSNNSSNTQQASVMRDRIEDILWLVASSPDAVVQK